jgi:hypothetical protein
MGSICLGAVREAPTLPYGPGELALGWGAFEAAEVAGEGRRT